MIPTEDAAVIYSLMGCCKLAEVDPKKWMNYFLRHVHYYDNDYSLDLAELLPHNLKKNVLYKPCLRLLEK